MKLLSLGIGFLSLLLSCGVAEAAELPKPVKAICGPQGDCVDANNGKHAVIEYDGFLTMVAIKEHADKTAKQKTHEQLGETEQQISAAVEAELRARIAELERREKWAVGSGIGIGAGTVAIIWALMWVLN